MITLNITPKSAAIAALIAAGVTAIALGPLSPPAGPVTETSPSLTELDAKVDQITNNPTSGPYDIFHVPTFGNFMTNQDGVLIAGGTVYVESFTVFFSRAALFDGAGSIDTSGRPKSENWVARANQQFTSNANGDGIAQLTSVTVPVETIVDNGLHVSWTAQDNTGYVIVRYKQLPQGATE